MSLASPRSAPQLAERRPEGLFARDETIVQPVGTHQPEGTAHPAPRTNDSRDRLLEP